MNSGKIDLEDFLEQREIKLKILRVIFVVTKSGNIKHRWLALPVRRVVKDICRKYNQYRVSTLNDPPFVGVFCTRDGCFDTDCGNMQCVFHLNEDITKPTKKFLLK